MHGLTTCIKLPIIFQILFAFFGLFAMPSVCIKKNPNYIIFSLDKLSEKNISIYSSGFIYKSLETGLHYQALMAELYNLSL